MWSRTSRVECRLPPSARQKSDGWPVLRLRDCALSTSGSEEQFFEHDGRRYGHIIDPRSGWPAEKVTSVSVVARSGAISDALATAFYIGGRELAEGYCADAIQDVLAIMLETVCSRDSGSFYRLKPRYGCQNS